MGAGTRRGEQFGSPGRRASRPGSKDDGAPAHRSAPLGSQVREAFFCLFAPPPSPRASRRGSVGLGPRLRAWKWSCGEDSQKDAGLPLLEPPPAPPPVSGCRARGLAELSPPPHAGPRSLRPRPRGERPGSRGPTAATQWRPRQAPRAPAASSPPRAGGAGRFQSRPARWGEGKERRETPAIELLGPRRVPHTLLGKAHSVVPAIPKDERPPIWASLPSPARPQSHHTHPWTPFSLLPSRSLNVRLPLAGPLDAALRRRGTRNLRRYHRAPATGEGEGGMSRRFPSFAPASLVLILSKEPRM